MPRATASLLLPSALFSCQEGNRRFEPLVPISPGSVPHNWRVAGGSARSCPCGAARRGPGQYQRPACRIAGGREGDEAQSDGGGDRTKEAGFGAEGAAGAEFGAALLVGVGWGPGGRDAASAVRTPCSRSQALLRLRVMTRHVMRTNSKQSFEKVCSQAERL
jgi:hypothetical protein